MKIQRLYVSHYKNLVDCEIRPTGIHAITGCNSSGKSNLLEVLPFVADIITGSDETRAKRLQAGYSPGGGFWIPFPFFQIGKVQSPFSLELSCHVEISDIIWIVDYNIKIDIPSLMPNEISGKIVSEILTAKPLGKTGKARILIERKEDGQAIAYFEKESRKKDVFKTKQDMSALQSLAVRQADDFPEFFPVTSRFAKNLVNSRLIRLDSESFRRKLFDTMRSPSTLGKSGEIVLDFDPYDFLNEIKNDKKKWSQFTHWLKEICGVEDINLFEIGSDQTGDSGIVYKIVMPIQNRRGLTTGELSMGSSVALGMLILLYSSLNTGAVILLEEPENHLHPRAIEMMIQLFREFSDRQTILFSTHSPVMLNSLQPSEVTVMRSLEGGFAKTQRVEEIKEAIDALNRGFYSLGDLLQTNFQNE